jgi:hypothetical protein
VEGPTCKNKKVQGLFKENGLVESWIVDPMTAVAVDRTVSPAHGSTVDQAKGYLPCLDQSHPCVIERPWWTASGVQQRTHREQRRRGGTRRRFTGVSPGRGSRLSFQA